MKDTQEEACSAIVVMITVITLVLSVLIAGCSTFRSGDVSEVQLSIQGNSDVLRRVIHVQLTAPRWTEVLTGADFGYPDSPNHTKPLETPEAGNLQVEVVLKDSTGEHVSSGSITIDIRPDWRWGVDIVLWNENPFYGCFGCVGYKAFYVDSVYRRTPEDSLYVVWGGNWIKHPVIY
jgi:hypothetical protein